VVPLTVPIALDSTGLTDLATRDPADRFIAATARALSAHLVTCDEPLLNFGATGRLLTVDDFMAVNALAAASCSAYRRTEPRG
jgi:PIN domain nuclease of toxin-antitoxin system